MEQQIRETQQQLYDEQMYGTPYYGEQVPYYGEQEQVYDPYQIQQQPVVLPMAALDDPAVTQALYDLSVQSEMPQIAWQHSPEEMYGEYQEFGPEGYVHWEDAPYIICSFIIFTVAFYILRNMFNRALSKFPEAEKKMNWRRFKRGVRRATSDNNE